MELAGIVGEQVLSMLLIILVGVVLARVGLANEENSRCLSVLMMYVFIPAMLVNVFHMDFEAEKLKGLLFSMAVSLFAYLFMIVLVHFVFLRKGDQHLPVERDCSIYSNNGNVAVPLILASMGQDAAFYTCGVLFTGAFVIWTHGYYLMCGDRNALKLKNILLNVNILAGSAGFILFLTQVKLPSVVNTGLNSLAGALLPVNLLLVGIIMGNMKLKEIFGNPRAYYVCFLRLIALPLALILALKAMHLSLALPAGKLILTAIIIANSAPVAANITMFAHVTHRRADYASQMTVLSSILSVLTLPVIAAAAQIVL